MAGYLGLYHLWLPAYALRWLVLTTFMLGYVSFVLWRGLSDNHHPGDFTLLPYLGWGNVLTLLRGALLAALLGFTFAPRPEGWLAWLPGTLYALADATDFFDGYVARRTQHVTVLGEKLDMSMDGMGVFLASLLAVRYGQVPVWYLFVGSARFLFMAGEWLYQKRGRSLRPLGESVRRRAMAGLQMGFLAVMLWPIFTPPGTHIAATLIGLPFLLGFLWDWLSVSGTVPVALHDKRKWLDYIAAWLPTGLRSVLLVIAVLSLIGQGGDLPKNQGFLVALEGGAIGMMVLGFAPRLNAILGLCLIGVHQIHAPLSQMQIALIGIYSAILFLGSGELSLWQPEERWITHRAGERHV